jgi:hypothetical protein
LNYITIEKRFAHFFFICLYCISIVETGIRLTLTLIMRALKKYLILIFILIITINSYSQNEKVVNISQKIRTYLTKRLITSPPIIDGKLNDACWHNNNWAGDFTQWIPKEGAKPSQKTTINILYDNKNLYVAIRAYDSEPGKISKKAGRRDEITGDMVGIDLDTYHDHRTGFEFNVSAAGQKVDLILTNPSNADMSWDAVWSAKVGFEDSAWVAEFEIPLSQLRYSNEKEQTWGMHIWRWIERFQEESDWEPQTSTGPGILYLFGHLEGISDLPKSRRVEIMPYVLGKIETFKKDAANPYEKDGFRPFGSIGLDAKIGLSSNFTADVTINPDFGQVESDPSEMNLSAFETFHEEKRPFFLEGKNIFAFDFSGMNLFYSRRIGQSPSYYPELANNEYMKYPENTSILSAVKISGKTANGFSMGIIQSITNKEMAYITNGSNERKEAVEPLSSYTVARFQKDYNGGNTVLGGIMTSVNRLDTDPHFDFLNKNALTGGIDFLHQWHDKEFYLNAKLVGSNIGGDTEAISNLQKSSARYFQRPDAEHFEYDGTRTRLSGHGGNIQIGKGSKGFLRYSTSLSWQSPGLELNDMGYMLYADQVKNTNNISYFTNQPKGIIRTLNTSFSQINNWDYALNYLSSQFSSSFYSQFLNQWVFNARVNYFPTSTDTKQLRGGSAMKANQRVNATLSFGSDESKKFAFSLYGFYDICDKSSYKNIEISPWFCYRPVNTVRISLSADLYSIKDELQYVKKTSLSEQPVYILGGIDRQILSVIFRVDYNITPEVSIQYYGSPYYSIGNYFNFKWVDNPMSEKYNDRFKILEPALTTDNEYITPEGIRFSNPDFCFTQFRSNLVFRWEYFPGSKLYFVWSNERTYDHNVFNPNIKDAISSFGKAVSKNIFLVKISYWFSL